MSVDSINIATTPLHVGAQEYNEVDIHNGGPGTLYYKSTKDVSSSSHDGTIADGATRRFRSPQWIVTTTNSKVFLDHIEHERDQINVHGIVNTRALAGSAAEPINVMHPDYGAVGDGVTDDSAAIQAAIDAVPQTGTGTALAKGGVVYFPHTDGGYNIGTTTLDLDDLRGVQLIGDGTSGSGPSRIIYSGTGTAIQARSTLGFRMEGIYLEGYDATTLLDFSATSVDTTLGEVSNCILRGTNGATSQYLVMLDKATVIDFYKTYFYGGDRGVVGNTINNGYSNTINLRSCHFQYQKTASIYNPGQAWTVADNTFEPLYSGAAGSVVCGATGSIQATQAIYIAGNSFQDATGGNWLTLTSSGVAIIGNMFSTGAKHIRYESANPIVIMGNWFEGATTSAIDFSLVPTDSVIKGNTYTNNADDFTGSVGADSYTDDATGVPWTAVSFSGSWVDYGSTFNTCAYRRIGNIVQVKGVAKSGTADTTIFTLPAGYRPPATVMTATATSAGTFRLDVTAAGEVYTTGSSANSYVSVDITFGV